MIVSSCTTVVKTFEMLKIFIGYDPKESIAFHTLSHSLIRHCTKPLSIIPLNLDHLADIYFRDYDQRQSNTFSFSRFLIPYLCDYQGQALYMDCDMMVRGDASTVFDDETLAGKAVSVVQHDYVSKVTQKYLGNKQYNYPRKNWSSFILWDCGHPVHKQVTPEFVASADAATLHRFLWVDDSDIGSISDRWNWLVGEYENPPEDVKNVHWTLGGPYFEGYQNADFADEWRREYDSMTFCEEKSSDL